jgi:hypothetical protein
MRYTAEQILKSLGANSPRKEQIAFVEGTVKAFLPLPRILKGNRRTGKTITMLAKAIYNALHAPRGSNRIDYFVVPTGAQLGLIVNKIAESANRLGIDKDLMFSYLKVKSAGSGTLEFLGLGSESIFYFDECFVEVSPTNLVYKIISSDESVFELIGK